MDLHEKWPHRWTNSKIEAQNSSIEGVGIFAREKIHKGEPVIILGGVVVPINDLAEYKQGMGQIGVQIDDGFFLAPTTRNEIEKSGAVNHSCDPNIGFDGSVIVKAIRDIEIGEECLVDYAFAYTLLDPFDCNCESDNCRKHITGNDWQIKGLQEKYGDYFAYFIRKKFS